MKIKHIVATALAAASFVAVTPVKAATIQLGFILDRSGSINATNWNTIVDGLSSAIGTLIPVGGANTYEISVVSFATTASTDITRISVLDLATRSALATSIFNLGDGRSNDVYVGGNTCFSCAFTAMTGVLDDTINSAAFSYVNFATDGVQNTGGTGVAERNALQAAGVDNLSVEAIGSNVDAADLQANFCFPGPCDTTSPYNFPTQGFYIGVANAAAYAAAIGNKIRVVTGQVPEPGTIALLGISLLGLGATRRRKQAA